MGLFVLMLRSGLMIPEGDTSMTKTVCLILQHHGFIFQAYTSELLTL